jgi:hypothetical protein
MTTFQVTILPINDPYPLTNTLLADATDYEADQEQGPLESPTLLVSCHFVPLESATVALSVDTRCNSWQF